MFFIRSLYSSFLKGPVNAAIIPLTIALSLIAHSCTPPPPPSEDTTGKSGNTSAVEKTDITAQHKALGRCMNLGNALDAPKEGEWGVVLQESYFSHVKELGFESVRIPIRWSTHTIDTAPWTIDESFFKRVEWAVDQALKNNLRTLINIHHYEELMSDFANHKPKFLSLWKQISKRFSSYGPELYFELCNEPSGQLTAAAWNDLTKETVALIRKTNPNRTLIIGPVDWNSVKSIRYLKMPEDSNLIATVHYYEPIPFTHQGAMWVTGSDMWKGIRWRASDGDTSIIIRNFDMVDKWSIKNNIPVFLGEFGALDTADTISRVLYTSFVAKQAKHRGWSYAYWKYNNNYGIYDDSTDVTRDFLVNALLKPDSTFSAWMKKAATDTIIPETGSDKFIVLDDFDDSLPAYNSIAARYIAKNKTLPNPGWCKWNTWFMPPSTVTDANGTIIANVDDTTNGVNRLIISDGESNKCLYAKVLVKGTSYPSINISTTFTGEYNKNWFDLSDLTAITFRAKGNGLMRIGFITDTILNGYPEGENWGHFGCEFSLSPEWKLYTIPVKNIQPKPWSKAQQSEVMWDAGMKKVCSLEFSSSQQYDKVAEDSLEIFIDDIKLYGLSDDVFGLTE